MRSRNGLIRAEISRIETSKSRSVVGLKLQEGE